MKIELKGFVKKITPTFLRTGTSLNGTNYSTRVQTLHLKVLGYTNEFGEKQGQDEVWQIDVINDKIEENELAVRDIIGKKVTAYCYLNSRQINDEDNRLTLRLANLEEYKVKQPV